MSTALDCLRELHSIREEMSTKRLVYGVILTSIAVASLFINTLLLFVILLTDAMDRFFRFYILSATLGGLVAVVAILSALSPAILFEVHLNDPTNIIISTTDTLGYLSLMITTTAIAFDRFLFFLMPRVRHLLSGTKIILPCFAALPWLATVLATIHMTFNGCYKRTDPYALTFTYSCSVCTYYGPVLYYAGYVFPAVNFALYSIVYFRIVALRLEFRSNMEHTSIPNSIRTQEVSLVIQFSLICLVQFGSSAFFYLLPPLTHDVDISFYVSMVFSAMNTMVNPVVMFIFQKRIRRACLIMLGLSPPIGDRAAPDKTVCRRKQGDLWHRP
ncbi:hypothetical protein Aduo_004464 [Ancylostoma duodenale]